MSGIPPGGYQVIPSSGIPPGGPPAGQFLAALQAITTALHNQVQATNGQSAALNNIAGLTPTNFPHIQLSESTAPAPPTSGAIIYVDSTTHHLMVVLANGTRTTLAA